MGDGGSLVGRAKALYLILFNLLSVGLWVAVLSITVSTITNELLLKGQDIAQVSLKVHAGAGPFIRFAQRLSWLEPVHVLLGLARGSLPAAVMQNFGRSMTLFGVLGLFTQGHATVYTTMLYTAWAGSEVIRYPYYLLGQLGIKAPYWLTWLRYSAFIVLYPIGIVAELMLYVVSLSAISEAVAKEDLFSYRMPNEWNFAFDFMYFVWFGLLVLYPISGPGLYMYMLKQRSATLKKARLAATEKQA